VVVAGTVEVVVGARVVVVEVVVVEVVVVDVVVVVSGTVVVVVLVSGVVVVGGLRGAMLGSMRYEFPYQRSGSPQHTPALSR